MTTHASFQFDLLADDAPADAVDAAQPASVAALPVTGEPSGQSADADAGAADCEGGPSDAWLDAALEAALAGQKMRMKTLQADGLAWAGLRSAVRLVACQKGEAIRLPLLAADAERALFGWAARMPASQRAALDRLSAARIEVADIAPWPAPVG